MFGLSKERSEIARRILAFRRQEKKLLALGYRRHETDWEIHRGYRYNDIIIDARISVDGKYVYTLIGPRELVK